MQHVDTADSNDGPLFGTRTRRLEHTVWQPAEVSDAQEVIPSCVHGWCGSTCCHPHLLTGTDKAQQSDESNQQPVAFAQDDISPKQDRGCGVNQEEDSYCYPNVGQKSGGTETTSSEIYGHAGWLQDELLRTIHMNIGQCSEGSHGQLGGPRSSRRRFLTITIQSVLFYGAEVWADPIKQKCHKKKFA